MHEIDKIPLPAICTVEIGARDSKSFQSYTGTPTGSHPYKPGQISTPGIWQLEVTVPVSHRISENLSDAALQVPVLHNAYP
jgi:hypothetical protein